MNSRERALARRGIDLAPTPPAPAAPAPLEREEIETRAALEHWLLRYRFGRIMQALAVAVWLYMTFAHGKPGFVFGLVAFYAIGQTMPRQDPDLDRYTGRK
jgi:hypothetical protein